MFYRAKFLTLVTAVALSCLTTSCDKGDDEDDYYPPYEPTTPTSPMVANPNSLEFRAEGETKTVTIRNATSTLTYSGPDWVTVSNSYGQTYSITAKANSGAARSGSVSFYAGQSSVSVSLYQSSGSSQGGNQGGGSGNNPNPGENTNTAPAVPTGLRATPDGTSSAPYALLNWTSVSDATSYIVFRSTSANGSYSNIGTTSINSYADNSVKYGNTYYYKIKASNKYGTSDYSNYVVCEFTDTRTPAPVTYGNCTVSGTTMTLRWSVPRDPSYGTATKAILRVKNPDSNNYADLQTLSGTATSASFTYTPWVDKNGYVYAGIILENENGSGGGVPKVYDTKNKRWLN